MEEPIKYRQGRDYKVQSEVIYELLLNNPTLLHNFVKKELSDYFGRELFFEDCIIYVKSNDFSQIQGYYETDTYLGLKEIDKDNATIMGLNMYNRESFCISDKGFPYNGDYLFLATLYFFTKKILSLGAKNVRLVCFLGGENADMYVNNEQDIAVFFDITFAPELIEDEETGEKFMGIWSFNQMPWSKKASDLLVYLQQPYDIACKMEGFPKEWLM